MIRYDVKVFTSLDRKRVCFECGAGSFSHFGVHHFGILERRDWEPLRKTVTFVKNIRPVVYRKMKTTDFILVLMSRPFWEFVYSNSGENNTR